MLARDHRNDWGGYWAVRPSRRIGSIIFNRQTQRSARTEIARIVGEKTMTGRRKSDRLQYRLIIGLSCLSCAASLLAATVSYRAIRAIDITVDVVKEAAAFRRRPPHDF